MQQLEEIVKFYLTSDTNHAIMITGEWGVGKTYYFKNILKNKIKEISTFEDDSKKYKPLLVSLFGLKSIEEIQTEIFLTIYPILKNKTIKLGANIGKSLIKGILYLKNLGNYSDYVSDFEIEKGEWIKFSDLVICFDDLERISEHLNIEEFIGYVNSLVENENVKVLIIANENKINRQNYFALKEKTIGNSIEFIPDLNKSFDSLVELKFSSFNLYKTFLNNNKNIILKIYTKVSNNIRILSFALVYFHRIFSELNRIILSYDALSKKKEEILLTLLKFSITISIEYKEGKISFKKKHELYVGDFDWSNFTVGGVQFGNQKKDKKEEDKTYREKFMEKYYPEKSFIFFTSIFDFITGGSILYSEKLIAELLKLYHIQENTIPIQYEVLNRLGYPKVFSLSDKEYKSLTRQMLNYSDKGLYDITNYLTIFDYSTRFDNPIMFNLYKLEKRIINGMKKGKSTYKFDHSLNFQLRIDDNSKFKNHLLKIIEAALQINNEIEIHSKQTESEKLENSCYNDFENFYEEVYSQNSQYRYIPIFKHFNAYRFYNFFIKSSGEIQWTVIRFWSNRYKEYLTSELKQEKEFLESLMNNLKRKLKILPKRGLKNYLFTEHINILQSSIGRLNGSSN